MEADAVAPLSITSFLTLYYVRFVHVKYHTGGWSQNCAKPFLQSVVGQYAKWFTKAEIQK